MLWDRTNRPLWLRCSVGVLLAIIAAAIRLQFLEILELRVTFVTFYPAVAVAALYGGFSAGLLATVVSAALADYFWMEPIGQFGITNSADLISMVVFLASGALISYLAEAAYLAQARAHKAEEQSKLAAECEKAAFDLQQSESKYRELVQNTNSAIIRWKRDGAISFFNEYAQKFFGYSAEEVIGKHVNILIPEQESTGGDLTGLFQRIVNHPESYVNIINENVLRDGSRVWMAWTNRPVFDQDGQVLEIFAVGSDITERKRMEEELRESKSRLDLALRSSQMGVWHLDLVENKRHFDDQVCRLFGINPAEFTGTEDEFYRVVHSDDREMLKAQWARTIEQDVPYETEYRAVWPDGSVHYVTARGKSVHDDKGQPVRVNGLIWDTTERKRMEETLRTTVQRFHRILSNIFVGILVVTEDGRIEFANQNFCDQFDIAEAPSDLIGLTAKEMLQKVSPAYAYPEAYLVRIQQILSQRHRIEDEEVLMRNGRVLLRDHIPILVDGKPRGRMWQHRDITQRRQAEEDVRRQREWLRVTLTSIGDAVIATDASGLITFINPVAEALTGWQIQEAVGLPVQKVFRIINEKTHEPLADIAEHVLREGTIVALANHSTLVSRDGREIPIEDSAAPIKDDTGKISGSVLVFHDVTERRRAQETLRASEEHYRSLFDNMLNGYAYCKMHFEQDRPIDFTYLDVNGAFETLTGLRDVVGRKVSEVIPGIRQSDPELLELYGRVALTGIPERCETYVESLGMWFSISAYSLHKEYFVAVFDVITERKRTEEALQLSESRFKLLSETASQLLASENPQAIVEDLCRQVMQHLDCHVFFNFMVDDIMGKLHLNAYAGIPEQEARKIEWLDYGVAVSGCAARDGIRIVAEDIFNTPDIRTELAKSYGIQAYACHPLEVQGKVIGTLSFGTKTSAHFSAEDLALMKTVADQVATAMDKLSLVDELRNSRDELELRVRERTAELNAYMAKLEQSNQALQDFASIAAHDMKEPLRKVISFGNMLRQKYEDSLGQTGSDYLQRMLNATERMQSLLAGLLDYSRVAMASEPFKEVDLSDLIGEVISDLEVRIAKTGGEVHIGALPVISADPTQMRQLFQNLIGNALKFHKPGEKPTVQVLSVSHSDSESQIIVEDNGTGFDEQYLDKIFAPFQRFHARSEYEGTGMGLAICKKIVERHGGSITAKSTPGAGSKFIVTLPVRSRKAPRRKPRLAGGWAGCRE